jgi:hypothetical protein
MTNTKHTPGPWTYSSPGNVIRQTNGPTVADCNGMAIRNRNLIAAAPELYEALDALSLAAYGAVNAPGVEKYLAAFHTAQQRARAALAKVDA